MKIMCTMCMSVAKMLEINFYIYKNYQDYQSKQSK